MEEYELIFMPEANDELNRITDFLNTLSPSVAENQRDALIDAVDSLSELPNRCPPARDQKLAEKGYRYLTIKHYLIFFTVSENDRTVTIRSIIDGRSNYLSI